jgi:SAM-dependent methyltransferase
MKDRGYRCFAIDPDSVATTHARVVVGVDGAHTGTLESFGDAVEYDLITFNKVLEHVLVPVPELRRAAKLLRPDGFVYVELPDGNDAARHGGFVDRQEFYIEHLAIYNDPSLRFLAQQAGYECLEVSPVREPSGKFSIYSFLRPL